MATAARMLRSLVRLHGRTFSSSSRHDAAQNFTMPAMSPTMTEGNIGSWKIKEGDSYSAGDVLLEIETDKAEMDVEAQEDGMLFKIMQGDGTKAVKVGARIAVMAESGDDISKLSIPEDESTASEAQQLKEGEKSEQKSGSSSEPTASKESSREQQVPQASPKEQSQADSAKGKQQNPKYPLYPSVQFALSQHGLSKEDAFKIPATGPNGRLLKGDVLSYVGAISKDYSSQQSARVGKLAHLDLSNIEIATPEPPVKDAQKAAKSVSEPLPEDTEIAVPISLAAVVATQKRVRDTLGIDLPLSVFVGRASALANEDLPPRRRAPSADELFEAVVGGRAAGRTPPSKGSYRPYVSVLPAQNAAPRVHRGGDVFDELVGAKPKRPTPPVAAAQGGTAPGAAINVFSVTARSGEEARVQAYLQRMKSVLEGEPGRLVL